MPRLSLWNSGKKGNTYRFMDRAISEWFGISGTAIYVHMYQGHHQQGEDAPSGPSAVTSIQDVLLMENRDRKYSDEVFELRGVYNINDSDFDMRQFAMFLGNDALFIEFHLNDCLAQLGRKLMSGDVIELPHLRDDALLDDEAPAINKFYVVEDVNKAADGYSPTWFPHILRVKVSPMTAAQEYQDILDKQAKDPFGFDSGVLGDVMSSLGREMGINEAIVDAAKLSVKGRNFETRQFYVVPGDELTSQLPWVFAGDGVPPNGAELVGSGNQFPTGATDGDYYLRTDYEPKTLFRRKAGRWTIQEQDYREGSWSAARRLLEGFINNNRTTTFDDGSTADVKTSLHKAVKPGADF